MRYINFLGISFCLLLNIFTLYSSEMENTIEDEKNPLRQQLCCEDDPIEDDPIIVMLDGDYWSPDDARQDNPLKKMETYFDGSGNFTLDKAKELIEQKIKEEDDIVNSQGTSQERTWNKPLEWLCVNACCLEPLTKENRLEIAKFFVENGANNESIEEASLSCLTDPNLYISRANSSIKEFLDSVKNQRRISIDKEEVQRMKKYEKERKERVENKLRMAKLGERPRPLSEETIEEIITLIKREPIFTRKESVENKLRMAELREHPRPLSEETIEEIITLIKKELVFTQQQLIAESDTEE